jgi:hypothetical protein
MGLLNSGLLMQRLGNATAEIPNKFRTEPKDLRKCMRFSNSSKQAYYSNGARENGLANLEALGKSITGIVLTVLGIDGFEMRAFLCVEAQRIPEAELCSKLLSFKVH